MEQQSIIREKAEDYPLFDADARTQSEHPEEVEDVDLHDLLEDLIDSHDNPELPHIDDSDHDEKLLDIIEEAIPAEATNFNKPSVIFDVAHGHELMRVIETMEMDGNDLNEDSHNEFTYQETHKHHRGITMAALEIDSTTVQSSVVSPTFGLKDHLHIPILAGGGTQLWSVTRRHGSSVGFDNQELKSPTVK